MTEAQTDKLWEADWYLQRGRIDRAREIILGVVNPSRPPDSPSPGRSSVIAAAVQIAAGEVGVREAGQNSGARVREYQSATWLPPGPWPWCAAFICWVLREAARVAPPKWKLPKTAGAYDFENWARDIHPQTGKPMARSGGAATGIQVIKPAPAEILVGDIVIFQFSGGGHIGIAASTSRGNTFETIEGNTNDGGSREGDGVFRRERSHDFLRSVIRLPSS